MTKYSHEEDATTATTAIAATTTFKMQMQQVTEKVVEKQF